MNNVSLIGRIAKELELKYTSGSNTAVAGFSIAVDDGFGEKKKTHFINCTAWGKTAENLSKFTKKGDLIGLTGRITTRDWEDKDSKKHYVTEVTVEGFTFCGGKKSDEQVDERMNIKAGNTDICTECGKPLNQCDCLPF